ncbi:MAG: SAM-dependent chlorinase/fluorinase [Thermoleophilia bacterium]|nr:SAM-dependent chlorinase/fluorinase [Thermoleophilia bacterium]
MSPPDAPARVVTLTTDFGPGSEHVGALHAVIVAHRPDIARVDFAHDIAPGEVRWAALQLARCVSLLPDAVHLAVVDPGVGSDARRPVAVRLRSGGYLVGPDNGLLEVAVDEAGLSAAVQLDPAAVAGPVSATFHGRDLFAPAAARLAVGAALESLGPAVPAHSITRPRVPDAVVGEGILAAELAGRDAYGNASVLAGIRDVARAGLAEGDHVSVEVPAGRHPARMTRTFADAEPGEMLVHIDSHGMVAVAVNRGSAWDRLEAHAGQLCCITRSGFGSPDAEARR